MFRNALKPLNWAKAVYSVAMLAVFLLVSVATAQAATVTLAWNASTGPVSGYNVYYGTASGSYPTRQNAGNATTYTTPNLSNGRYYFVAKAYDSAGRESGPSNQVSTTVGPAPPPNLPSPWLGMDVGNVGLAGSAGYANGTYTLKGSGADIEDRADAFRFAYQPLTGNGTITARVASLANTDSWAKAGVMIRENLDANARHAMVVVTPREGVAFQRRLTTGGTSYHTAGAAVAAPYWVRLTRAGSTFTAYQSGNGTNWTSVGSTTIRMATSVYVGLALTSHNNSALSTTMLDNVRVTGQ